jgi:hypothetical protein
MKERNLIIAAIATAGLVASCTPFPEQPEQPTEGTETAQEENTLSSTEQQKLQEERKKAAEEAKRKLDEESGNTEGTGAGGDTAGNGGGTSSGSQSWEFARAVPGKEGFVFSPYNNKVIDVRDIPSGTLVQDPTYPASEKKYFRVP